MNNDAVKKTIYYILCTLTVGLTVLAFKRIFIGATPATIALIFVLEILVAATFAGFGPGLLAAVMSSLCFNFFFLPPYGTLFIANSADIVAFCVFVITAIIVSQLSSAVRQRAKEAERRKDEVERLYKFAKTMIETPETLEGAASIASKLVEIFGIEYAGIYVPDKTDQWKHVSVSSDELKTAALPEAGTLQSNSIGQLLDEYGRGVQYTVMKSPTRTVGVMALRAKNLSPDTIHAIASLVALTVERNRLVYATV